MISVNVKYDFFQTVTTKQMLFETQCRFLLYSQKQLMTASVTRQNFIKAVAKC